MLRMNWTLPAFRGERHEKFWWDFMIFDRIALCSSAVTQHVELYRTDGRTWHGWELLHCVWIYLIKSSKLARLRHYQEKRLQNLSSSHHCRIHHKWRTFPLLLLFLETFHWATFVSYFTKNEERNKSHFDRRKTSERTRGQHNFYTPQFKSIWRLTIS